MDENKHWKVVSLLKQASTNLGISTLQVEREYLKSVPIPCLQFSHDHMRKLEILSSPHWKALLKVWEIQHET